MATRYIFAPDLPASLRWYTDVFDLAAAAAPADPATLCLPGADLLVFSAQAPPGPHVLPVASVAAVRRRFEQRPVMAGENQGRIVAAGPGHLTLVDPANNELTLLEPNGKTS
jgi:catechol 2,3-dioxygenase-like lactoylglutathione lyase family enzyme